MRTLVLGDIHGCSAALDYVLNMARPQPEDTIITLGDQIDRGPDTRGVVERLLRLKSRCTLIPLKGNHEFMMLASRSDPLWEKNWRGHGGQETLISYAPEKRNPTFKDVPAEHWDFLEHECLDYWETETHIFVHANLTPELPLSEQAPLVLFWEFLPPDPQPHHSGKMLICGHTAQETGRPLNLGHTLCLDTYAYGGGFLSCLDLDTGIVYQASQSGFKRQLQMKR
jgi:serine/threonine protein phosphatase 1